ncbi:MAG TPA: tagaturonate epimerase family protein [Defluviitoga sp.]|nr:tagaturonate epimerase family protein [Defluviitoga sp.]HQD63243.1 tagaturonate epimerase family protein [Defluviitoga sp.]
MFLKLPEQGISLGLGDRVGLATPGHIKVAKQYNFFPVFAQQSIRELNFTGRTFQDVKKDVEIAAIKENYEDKSGFDGDHLKTDEEIQVAIDSGITMLTLDCSEYMDVESKIKEKVYKQFYGKTFQVKDLALVYTQEELEKILSIYSGVIERIIYIWNNFPKVKNKDVSFEVSIDETNIPTDEKTHFLLSKYLYDEGITIDTLAPRFPGEFQKGIDYIGNIEEFKSSLIKHYKIASYFGYRLSIHSGSDKFAIYPYINQVTQGNYHLKTSGTSYLQALKIVAQKAPDFFLEIWKTCLDKRKEMDKYYHLSCDPFSVPKDLKPLEYLKNPNARQTLHVSYMFVLNPNYDFRNRFFEILTKYESEYHMEVAEHIERHVRELGIPERGR